jgi:ADP-ribosylglycohydrolase
LRQERHHKEVLDAIMGARALAGEGPLTGEAVERLGGGWTGEEALSIAIACALTAQADSPNGVADALWRAVAHSGDSDSTGSIVGNLLGAMVGASGLPSRWVEQVELRDVLEQMAEDLYRAFVVGETPDRDRYPPN